MPSAFPLVPWRIADETSVNDRLRILRRLAEEGASDPVVSRFAETLRSPAAALNAVQRVGYVPDPPDQEWFQPSAYTLRHGGDCEDLVVLLASVFLVKRYPSLIVWLDQPWSHLNHVTCMVLVGGKWLWADPSIVGARLGEHPYAAVQRVGQSYKIGTRVAS